MTKNDNEADVRYKKIFWLSIFVSTVTGPIWFYALHALGKATNNPGQMFFLVWLMSLMFSLIFFFIFYSGEVMEQSHKKGIYYKLIIGLIVLMFLGALIVK